MDDPDDWRSLASAALDADRQALAILEFTPRAIVLRDDQGLIRAWNRAAAELYGYSPEEALYSPQHQLLATVFPGGAEVMQAQLLERGQWRGPMLQQAKGGRRLLLRGQHSLQRDPAGRPVAVLEAVETLEPEAQMQEVVPRWDPGEQFSISEWVRREGEIVGVRPVWIGQELALARPRYAEQLDRPSTEWYPQLLGSGLGRVLLQVARGGQAVDFSDARLQAPWMEGELVLAGRAVPFGDGVALRMRDVTLERARLQALDDAQARVRLALALAPLSVLQTDRELRVEWVTGSMGLSAHHPERLLGQRLPLGLDPEDVPRFQAAAERALAGVEQRLDVHLLQSTPEYVSLVMAPRRDDEAVAGLMIASLDISEQRRLLAEAQRSARLLRTVAEHTPDAVWLKDRDGHFVFANQAAAQALGRSAAELVGQTIWELLPYASAAEVSSSDRAVMVAGQPLTIQQSLRDGDVRIYETRKFPVRDPDGAVSGVGGISIDISDRVAQEEELRARVAALQHAGVGIALVRTSDLCIVEANQEYGELFGYLPQELRGMEARQLNLPAAGEGAEQAGQAEAARILQQLEQRGRATTRVHNRRRDGSAFWTEAVITPWQHPLHGSCWINVQRDISQQVQLEERLHRAETRLLEAGLG